MRKGKFAKSFAVAVAVGLIMCSIIGGTVAWLITKTDSVTNTFTYGDINITLGETTGTEYEMVPGKSITKDPKVTVLADSEDCWLFVKLEKSGNPAAFDDFMEYQMEAGWTMLDGVDGVYYREVAKSESEQSFEVIKDNTITVKGEVTKEMLNNLGTTYPTLTVTAYAVQRDDDIDAIDTAAEAWALAEPLGN